MHSKLFLIYGSINNLLINFIFLLRLSQLQQTNKQTNKLSNGSSHSQQSEESRVWHKRDGKWQNVCFFFF